MLELMTTTITYLQTFIAKQGSLCDDMTAFGKWQCLQSSDNLKILQEKNYGSTRQRCAKFLSWKILKLTDWLVTWVMTFTSIGNITHCMTRVLSWPKLANYYSRWNQEIPTVGKASSCLIFCLTSTTVMAVRNLMPIYNLVSILCFHTSNVLLTIYCFVYSLCCI